MCCHPDLNQYILDVLQMVKPLLEKVFRVQFCSTSVIFVADLLDSLFKYVIWIIKLSLSLANAFKSTSVKDNSFLLSYKQQTNLWMKPPHNSAKKDLIIKNRPLLNHSDCTVWEILPLADWEKENVRLHHLIKIPQ